MLISGIFETRSCQIAIDHANHLPAVVRARPEIPLTAMEIRMFNEIDVCGIRSPPPGSNHETAQ